MNELETNLVPLARLHDMTTSMAQILKKEKAESEKNGVASISEPCFAPSSFLAKLSDSVCYFFLYLFMLCTWLFATD